MWKSSDPRDTDAREEALWDTRDRGPDDPRDRDVDPRDVFREGLDLPRGRDRERVFVEDLTFELRGSEVRTLATIGAFRVVPIDDLRDDRGRSGGRPDHDQRAIERWALEPDLPFFDGHVHFPDVRLEYEWPDGRRDVENVEVTTLHYRGAHASAKARAGFTRFRATGGRVGGRSGRRGGRPFDPDVAGELLE